MVVLPPPLGGCAAGPPHSFGGAAFLPCPLVGGAAFSPVFFLVCCCFPLLGGAAFSSFLLSGAALSLPPSFRCCLFCPSPLWVVILSPPPFFWWCCRPPPPCPSARAWCAVSAPPSPGVTEGPATWLCRLRPRVVGQAFMWHITTSMTQYKDILLLLCVILPLLHVILPLL